MWALVNMGDNLSFTKMPKEQQEATLVAREEAGRRDGAPTGRRPIIWAGVGSHCGHEIVLVERSFAWPAPTIASGELVAMAFNF